MGTRILCKNAIVIDNGSIGAMHRRRLVTEQFGKPSSSWKCDPASMYIGMDIDADYEALKMRKPVSDIPRFSKLQITEEERNWLNNEEK